MDVFSFPMSDPSLTSLLLSTAAVAAAVGALVSAGIAALSDWRERVSRRKELLLSLAVDTANREITKFLENDRTDRCGSDAVSNCCDGKVAPETAQTVI